VSLSINFFFVFRNLEYKEWEERNVFKITQVTEFYPVELKLVTFDMKQSFDLYVRSLGHTIPSALIFLFTSFHLVITDFDVYSFVCFCLYINHLLPV
jgi:hypothetical protein